MQTHLIRTNTAKITLAFICNLGEGKSDKENTSKYDHLAPCAIQWNKIPEKWNMESNCLHLPVHFSAFAIH